MSEKEKMNTQNKKEISGFLKGVEIIGNKLPHPAMLFLLLAVIVVIISHFVAAQGVSVTYFDARAKAEVTKKAVSLLTPDGLRYMFNSATKNFTGFANQKRGLPFLRLLPLSGRGPLFFPKGSWAVVSFPPRP